tara:strand:- start:112 stop:561 length:450 start_codon:yes stop_codon:yes gene_type:complete
MTIDLFEFYHGAALAKLLNHGEKISIKTFPSESNATFTLNDKVGVYIKYSKKRMTPWVFTFKKIHQEELKVISELHKHTFLIMVCGSDGIACINYNQVKKLLDESFAEAEWIKAHRYRREQYSLTGSDGKLNYKMPKNSFPQDIIDLIK